MPQIVKWSLSVNIISPDICFLAVCLLDVLRVLAQFKITAQWDSGFTGIFTA